MKKIYMILAAMTLLSLSLNAQLLVDAQYSENLAGNIMNKGQNRAPLRLNEGEYTMGPFEGDHLKSGGYGYLSYPNPQWIIATTALNRDEFIGHEGDTIVGFRFALAGSASEKVRVKKFVSYFRSTNNYFNFPYSWEWPIGNGGTGGDHDVTYIYNYDDIVISDPSVADNFYSITVYDENNRVLTSWNRDTTTTTVTIGSTRYGNYDIPAGWSVSSGNYLLRYTDATHGYLGYLYGGDGSITISSSLLDNSSSTVKVVIRAVTDDESESVSVNGVPKSFSSSQLTDNEWTIEPSSTTAISSITVGDGATYSSDLPVYGYEQDYGYTTQMIYSAAQLGLESGSQITSLTFYPREGFGINFWGSTVTLKLGNTTVSNYGTGSSGTAITGLTTVASKQITATDPNCTAWTFTFDQPFTYNGNNIVVEVSCPGYRYDGTNSGQWATSYFMGDNQSSNVSLKDEDGGPSNFLPKASFGYTGNASASDFVDLEAGQWHDFYLDEPVLFTVPGDSINRLLIGYEYYQYPSGTTGQLLYPVAVNDESTGHNHYWNMYLQHEGTPTTVSDSFIAANGTSTSNGYEYLPVYGWYFEVAQTNQMIYTSSDLSGLQNGDEITSLTFYPRNNTIYFSGASMTISLANTTTSQFSSASALNISTTTVAEITSYTVNSNGEWTINFNTPFTYTGNNLLVQVSTTANGNYGSSHTYFNGASQSSYKGYNSYSGQRYQFLPKAKFGYNRETTSAPTYEHGWWGMNLGSYDMAVQLILKPGKEKTPTPEITYTYDNGYYYITATATGDNADNATVTLTVNGTTVSGTHSVTIPVGRLNGEGNDYTVTATATAVEPDKSVSDPANATITVEGTVLDPTPDPTINTQTHDLTVEVSGSGQGDVHMYIDGQEVTSPTYLERTDEEYTVQVTVTAQITDGEHSMATTTQTVVVPPLSDLDLTGWTQLPGLYNNGDVINWDNNLMFIDRFTASTAHNDHATQYKYVMTENNTKLNPPLRSTNEHLVPVQRTNSKVLGYYTENDVLLDRDRNHVKLNVMNADVEMYLENNNDIYYYTLDRSKNNKDADEYYLPLSELQNAGNNYIEKNDYYTLYEPFEFGKVNRFDTINAALPATIDQGDQGRHYGAYDENFMSYVPIVWTFGNKPSNKRANWDNDHKHNSYGSPIWQTGVGKTKINYIQIERQKGKDNSTNWNMDSVMIVNPHYYEDLDTIINGQTEHWQDTLVLDTTWRYTPCSLFMVKRIDVDGFLPSNISNIEYEPYMFRVWVASPTNRLREYTLFPADSTAALPGQHYGDTLNLHLSGPFCIWEEYFTPDNESIVIDGDNPLIYHFIRDKVEHTDSLGNWDVPEDMNMIFAAEDSISASDVVFYVRFYYRSTGDARNTTYTMTYMLSNRDGESTEPKGYYGVEDEGNPDREIPTSIRSIYDLTQGHGEVVSVTYYNLQGMASKTPFDGINIVVKRYSDGSTTSSKIIRRQ